MGKKPADSFGARTGETIGRRSYEIFRLDALERRGVGNVSRLPLSLKVLLENLLRHEDGTSVRSEDIEALARWEPGSPPDREIAFRPARVLLQDFTGVPALVDLAAMRDAARRMGGDPKKINPQMPADLIIDHSVQVDRFGSTGSFGANVAREMERNGERYAFLRWGQEAFRNLRVVPPGTGICHQVNLEYLAPVVFRKRAGRGTQAYPDTLVGTDSHTPMINGLGVVGWGVGGIEAEAALLGQPVSMLVPDVVGFRLSGRLPAGATATDLVLTVTQMLRAKGVVGKFVEFHGPGLSSLSLPDRATISNMSPEYGATIGFFPVDDETLRYLRLTGREAQLVDLVERYCKEQGLFHLPDMTEPGFSEILELDLGEVETSLAGPKRPQDRVPLSGMKDAFHRALLAPEEKGGFGLAEAKVGERVSIGSNGTQTEIGQGAVVIAAITSCTNTSNPSVMVAAGLLAQQAVSRGMQVKPYVKTSMAPGSRVVTAYLEQAGLLEALGELGFNVVGYGCTTCIGNSGPLPGEVVKAITQADLVSVAVLSGNRNFEGRINPYVRASFLASPPLVVAYALAGTTDIDLLHEPLGRDRNGQPVYLREIWPSRRLVQDTIEKSLKPEMFAQQYSDVFSGNDTWNAVPVVGGDLYVWEAESTYIQEPPFFTDLGAEPEPISDIASARCLVMLGDSVTTDHISPAGAIPAKGPAGRYLTERGVQPRDFNSFGSRRGNDQVMTRGTFGNIRLKNMLVPGVEGGQTIHMPDGAPMTIYEAALRYQDENVPLIVIAGKEYGSGSSRDWAAKGPRLLGVRAVIARSFERIHRSNLIGMGVLPLEFAPEQDVDSLGLSGRELFSLRGLQAMSHPNASVRVIALSSDGSSREFQTRVRIDTPIELEIYRNGGILHMVLRQMLSDAGDPKV